MEEDPQEITFTLKTVKESHVVVTIGNDAIGDNLALRASGEEKKEMHLKGKCVLLFRQRELDLSCVWNPDRFTQVGIDPVEIAMTMIEEVIQS